MYSVSLSLDFDIFFPQRLKHLDRKIRSSDHLIIDIVTLKGVMMLFGILVYLIPIVSHCASIPAPAEKAAPSEKTSSTAPADAHEEFVDDFRVGERVWVNGNKPGFIQFLGETQFAPGQWAGIVLDEPIGKNDGSVAGVRYFQCEPLRGIFTRPSKLTRKVVTEDEANGTQTAHASRATSPTSTSVSSSTAALPPSGIPQKTSLAAKEHTTPSQISNLSKTASESISNLSEAGSLKKGERELKIGDRVLVRFPCLLLIG